MKRLFILAITLAACLPAALTEEQRVQDFQTVASLYAKSYGPANWKIQALGVNIFDTAPWMRRVRAATSDLEHAQILMEYVGSFQDTHSRLTMTSNFVAQFGFFCDLYDGKVVIDLVDRTRLPLADYPFVNGDELVSVDGRPALEIARELTKTFGYGNPRALLRIGVQRVTSRGQSGWPQAVNLPEESDVVILRQNGETETYKLKWIKTGYPIRSLGVAPNFGELSAGLRLADEPTVEPTWNELPAWKKLYYDAHTASDLASDNRLRADPVATEDGRQLEPRALINYGSRFPVWRLPTGFRARLGGPATDVFYSGTYMVDGQRIGYLRLGSFPTYTTAQITQLATEIAFFNANTDGLVLDVMRNTGGTVCSAVDLAAFVVPKSFLHPGLSIRPTLSRIVAYDNQVSSLEAQRAPQHFIDIFKFQRDLLLGAFNDGRGITGSIPVCDLDFEVQSESIAYAKPMIVLVDDFSTSTADYFPAMIQDNQRAKLVGTRTNGAGGDVIDTSAGFWSETNTRLTRSLMYRTVEREYENFPKSPYVENVGVRPDIELDYMTVENLVAGGTIFVDAFSRILVNEILGVKP